LSDFNESAKYLYGQAPAECSNLTLACWGPGGYFGERPFHKAEWHQRLRNFHGQFLELVRHRSLPSVVYGVSVGPLSDLESRDFVHQCLSLALQVFVRDSRSYAETLGLGIEPDKVSITPDAIFLLRPNDIPGHLSQKYERLLAIDNGRKKVGLHLPDITGGAGTIMGRLEGCVEALTAGSDGTDFYLIADNPNQQGRLADIRAMLSRTSNVYVIEYSGVIDLVGLLSHLDTVVTTKLHVGLCSFVLGHLPVSVYQHPKVLEQYKEAGISEQCCSVEALTSQWLSEAVGRSLNFPRGGLAAEIVGRRDIAKRDIQRIATMLQSAVQ
jgi:polysaccharide pyruvyl transferase WcaK-like protein